MSQKTAIWALGIGLILCLAISAFVILYFLKEWKKLENILESFQNENISGVRKYELLETRESKMVSKLLQILGNAQFKEERAVGEKDQVMQLISDLSHQLKTPLANIVMNMELLRDDKLTKEQQTEFLEHTEAQAGKMQWLMNSLLKASRLENGMIQFQAENTGIKGTIAKAVSAVYVQASAKQIRLSIEEFQDFELYHNPKWTAEAMTNILENAVKYSPKNSQIKITLSRMDIYTRITVSDEGIGIPENEYHRIFQRFYRGKAVEQQEGSGLGLYLAQLILQHEKGYITVSSKPGQGSSFHVFLLNPIPPFY
ncbi:MAG: HAMP domain-containing histidine kinase [Lachnospiraceae bacterium]|nr:HAMP domain-containing histidine kinase [Lachnospiraceae bacterium]